LAFNLGLALHLRPFLGGGGRPRLSLRAAPDAPPLLRSLRVSLVREPAEPAEALNGAEAPDSSEELELGLQAFFAKPRLLSEGDVFAVAVAEGGGGGGGFGGEATPPRLTYFRCVEAAPRAGAMGNDTGRLVLDGTVGSPAPPPGTLFGYTGALLDCSPGRRQRGGPPLIAPPPPGGVPAHPAAAAACRLVAPLLHPGASSLELRCALMLKGPAGVGKRAVAHALAQQLGMNVVVYNCHELAASGGGAEGKVAQMLASAFEAAAQYTPALLVLRRFNALAAGGAPVAATPDAGAAATPKNMPLLARALERCVRQYSPAAAAAAAAAGAAGVAGFDEEELSAPPPPPAEGGDGGMGGLAPKARIWHARPPPAGGGREPSPGTPPQPVVLLLAAAEGADGLPPDVRRAFTHEIDVIPPDEPARAALLRDALGVFGEAVDVAAAAAATAGLMPRDLRALAADAGARASQRAPRDGGPAPQLRPADLEGAMKRSGARTSAAIGAPKVPDVTWDDVGGLEDAKKAILDTVQLPLRHRALFSSGGRRRSGALLYGPPGTGKTLLAKAVATQCGVRFLAVKGPELINMYIGESERNVREVFARARAARPCIVFFDELDALAPARGAGGDSGGVMDRVVSQLLAEVDGLSGSGGEDVFVIGATNRPDLIDPALLRPGRFDKLLFVGVDASITGRVRVLQALTRKFRLASDVALPQLAQRVPARYTGADMYALCADAWMRAAKRLLAGAKALPAGPPPTPEVRQEDFIGAMDELAPSLSAAELERYQALAASFEGTGSMGGGGAVAAGEAGGSYL